MINRNVFSVLVFSETAHMFGPNPKFRSTISAENETCRKWRYASLLASKMKVCFLTKLTFLLIVRQTTNKETFEDTKTNKDKNHRRRLLQRNITLIILTQWKCEVTKLGHSKYPMIYCKCHLRQQTEYSLLPLTTKKNCRETLKSPSIREQFSASCFSTIRYTGPTTSSV